MASSYTIQADDKTCHWKEMISMTFQQVTVNGACMVQVPPNPKGHCTTVLVSPPFAYMVSLAGPRTCIHWEVLNAAGGGLLCSGMPLTQNDLPHGGGELPPQSANPLGTHPKEAGAKYGLQHSLFQLGLGWLQV